VQPDLDEGLPQVNQFKQMLVQDLIASEVTDEVVAQIGDWAVDLTLLVIASGLIEQS